MKFLAILIVVIFYRNWVGGNPIRPLVPFNRYRSWFARTSLGRDLRYVLCVGLPALVLWLIVMATGNWLSGLFWLAICIVVLVYAIRIYDGSAAFESQSVWLGTVSDEDQLAGVIEQQRNFRSRVTYENFQSLSPALFWFLVFGPVGVIIYALSSDYLNEPDDNADKDVGLVYTVVFWMEWIPARVTGFIYALLGHFGRCFGQWLRMLTDTNTSIATTIDVLAKSALGDSDDYGQDINTFVANARAEITELHQLLDRTLWGWVGLAAIVTVIGW